jgi:hypothetical protein
LKTTPTPLKSLRNEPPQLGQVVSGSSVNDWTASVTCSQSAQRYSYVGTTIF